MQPQLPWFCALTSLRYTCINTRTHLSGRGVQSAYRRLHGACAYAITAGMPPSTEACVTHTGFAGPCHWQYVRRVQCLRLCTTRRKTTDNYREQIYVDTAGTVLVPRAGHFQCYNMNMFFSDKIHGSNFIKQHSETAMV